MAKVTFPYRGTSIDVVKSEIGLTNVNNTSDLEKPLSLATLDALRSKVDSWKLGSLAYRNTISFSELVSKPTTLSEAGITDKVATLVNGVIPASQLPSYVDDILEYATLTELQSASIDSGARVSGKIYLVTDTGKSYRWSGSTYIDISSKVDSVNGKTGAITITQSDIGLGNVSNTSDLDKPISTATASALNNKVTVEPGKGLSTNDYTAIDKRKLAELPSGWMFGALAFRNTVNYGELKEIPTVFKPDTHKHTIAEVTLLQETLNKKVDTIDGKGLSSNDYSSSEKLKLAELPNGWAFGALAFRSTLNYSELKEIPSEFSPSSHKHTISDITSLDTSLGKKVDVVEGKSLSENNYSNSEKSKLASLPSSWALGALAFRNTINYSELLSVPTSFVPSIHKHSISDVIDLQSTLDNKVTAIAGRGLSTNDYTDNDKAKVSSIIPGWMLGALAFRDRISFKELLDTQSTLSGYGITDGINISAIGNTIPSLVNGTIPSSQLPSYVDDVLEFSSISALQSATLASGAQSTGKIYITTDTGRMYRWSGSVYVDISSKVDSVNTKTGAVTLSKSDIGLANVDNTSDLTKPISTLTQTALNNKVDIVSGKVLSSNDYTSAEKTKLAELPNNWAFGAMAFRDRLSYGELLGVPSTFAPQDHSHTFDSLTDKPTSLDSYGILDGVKTTDSRLSDKRDPLAHSHTISDVSNLSTTLNTKVDKDGTKVLSSNDFTSAEKTKLSGLPNNWAFGALAFRNTVNYSELISIPTVFKPDTHDHTISSVTNLQTSLDNKVDKLNGFMLSSNDYTSLEKAKLSNLPNGWAFGALAFRNTINYSELLDKPAFGSLASKNSVTLSDITGLTGTASGATYLRGDGYWSTITLPSQATSNTNGIVKLGSDVPQTISAAAPTSFSTQTYPIQLDSFNRMVVNVPWINTVPAFGTGTVNKSFSVTVNGVTSYIPIYGIDNIDNTSDINKPISLATKAALTDKTSTWMLGALAFRNTVNYSELGGTLPTHNHSTTSITDWDKLNAITAKNIYLDTSGAAPYLRGTTDTSSIVIAGGKAWTGNGAIIQLFGNESPVDINSKSTKNGINIFGGGTSALGTQGQCIIDNFTKVGINTTSPSEVLSVNGSVVAIGYKTISASSGFLKADGTVDSTTYLSSLPTATATSAGVVKLGSGTQQATAANSVSSDSNRTYAIQVNSSNQMVVNVPWVDTDTGTNTTYTFAEGTKNGTFNVTPSGSTTATAISIHGLGGAAYKSDTDFATSTHSHSGYLSTSGGTLVSGGLGIPKGYSVDFYNNGLYKHEILGSNSSGDLLIVANGNSNLTLDYDGNCVIRGKLSAGHYEPSFTIGPQIGNTETTATNLILKSNSRSTGITITLYQSDYAIDDTTGKVDGTQNNLPGWDISLIGKSMKSQGIDNTLKFTAWSVPYFYNATTNKLSNKDSTGNLVTDNWATNGTNKPTLYIHEDGRIALYGNLSAVTGSNPDKSKAFKAQWPPKYGFICITTGATKITEVPYGANQEYGSLVGAPLYFDSNNKRLYIFDASDTDSTHLYGTWYYITATRDTTSTTGNPFSTINSLGKP